MLGQYSIVVYGLALAVTVFIAGVTAFVRPNMQLARCAAALFVNWLANTAFGLTTGITDGWWFNIIIDLATAAVVLWHPAGRFQAALGVSYCVQIAMHIGYAGALYFGSADPWTYYDWLLWVAFAQLLILGGWCGSIWFGTGRRSRRHRRASNIAWTFDRDPEEIP